MANPAAINITKNPQTKNKNVLNINPTSADTVESALATLVMLSKKNKLTKGPINFFKCLIIKLLL